MSSTTKIGGSSGGSTTQRVDHSDKSQNTAKTSQESAKPADDSARRQAEDAARSQSSFTPAKKSGPVALSVPSGSGAAAGAPTMKVGPGGALVANTASADEAAKADINDQFKQKQPNQGPAMTADQAFICQFTDPKYNPTGPSSSSNCGPASEAMAMAYMGKMPPGLTKEQQVDYARALMSPGRKSEFTYVKDANGQMQPQLNRDHEYTGGTMEEDGIRAAGGRPEEGRGWDALDKALENGPVISNGETNATWRAQFPQRMGSGDVLHVNTILGKTADGKYLVADPLHTGGPVAMTREQLSKFYSPTGGEPSFVATNYGKTSGAGTPATTPGTPGTPGGTPSGSVSVPQANLTYDGGKSYNADVEQLQRALVKAGYLSQADMDTGPGYYGDHTKAAVAQLQAKYGISDDGTHFGPQTRAALTQALAGSGETGNTGSAGGTVQVGNIQLSAKDAETAKRIDQMLATTYKDSRMQGMGAVLVDACRKEHIPLDLALAQLAKESTFLRSDNNLSVANNNPGNLRNADWEKQFGATPGQGNFAHFPSVEQGIRAYVHLLGSPTYRQDVDNRDWASLVHKYAPSSDGNNEAQYAQQLRDWTAYFAQKVGIDSNWVNEQ